MESDISKIKHTLEGLNRIAFSESVDAILNAKNIYITGARSSEPIARLLAYNLSLIFDNVKLVVPTSSAEVFEQMYSIGAEDVVIAFSFPRYSSKMINGIKFARQKEAKVVAFTDSEVSPIAGFANCLLIAQSDMASFMDSLVAPLSIINAIIIEITSRREQEITERFDALEKLWDEYEVYAKR
jgi:DNA-binding MurR/RpiR family transcriptional regulator